jgi:hypothetical protein
MPTKISVIFPAITSLEFGLSASIGVADELALDTTTPLSYRVVDCRLWEARQRALAAHEQNHAELALRGSGWPSARSKPKSPLHLAAVPSK